MNPWAGVIIAIAVLLFIIAWKGTQDNVLSAVLNRPYHGGGSGTANAASSAGTPTVQLAAAAIPAPAGTFPLPSLPA